MKNIHIIKFLSLILISCSNEIENETLEISLTPKSFVLKTFDTSNNPKSVEDSINYSVINNKISNYSGKSQISNVEKNGVYNYENGKISEIIDYVEGKLTNKTNFKYNDQGNLVEYCRESISSFSDEKFYIRHSFNHTPDSIFVVVKKSLDGINYDINESDLKIVLDSNNNRTYFEEYNYISNKTKAVISTYDTRSNLIKEQSFDVIINSLITDLTHDMTYDTSINT